MKFVIQRVTKAKCEVNHEITGAIVCRSTSSDAFIFFA